MYYCTLKKIESTHNNLRTESVKGLANEIPVVGSRFFMYSEDTLTPDTNIRYVNTSVIKDVKFNAENGDYVFRTENSLYVLTSVSKATTK